MSVTGAKIYNGYGNRDLRMTNLHLGEGSGYGLDCGSGGPRTKTQSAGLLGHRVLHADGHGFVNGFGDGTGDDFS